MADTDCSVSVSSGDLPNEQKPKTEAQLKKEAQKQAKLEKFRAKQEKLQQEQAKKNHSGEVSYIHIFDTFLLCTIQSFSGVCCVPEYCRIT